MIYFTKLEGTGNDFIAIDNREKKIKYDYDKLSEYLCNRNYGIGADGVLFVENSDIADCKMRIFNKDGSEAEMCGNGIRCFAKYIYDNKIVNKKEINIETLAGIRKIKLIFEGLKISKVIVNMGSPKIEYRKIPVYYTKEDKVEYMEIENRKCYPISMGNPHTVCFVENINDIEIEKEGPLIENYKYFPNKTNVEFVKVIDDENVELRVWERGVGETLSCGTGACSVAVIAHLYKGLKNSIKVKLKGGTLKIKYDKKDNVVWLEGDASKVFDGKTDI